jgi:aspartate/glutamate racemase
MKKIGLIGGMSWESSAEYYRLLNLLVKERLGRHANAKSLLLTVNFAEIERLQHTPVMVAAGSTIPDLNTLDQETLKELLRTTHEQLLSRQSEIGI